MHLSAQQFAILFVAFALAAVRLLTASQPFWNATPFAKWSTILGPAALAGFAAVPAALSGAHTWVDVGVALLTVAGVAMAAAHGNKVPPAVLMLLVAGLCLPMAACSRLAAVDWPKQLEVCAAPAESVLLVEVSDVLAGTEDVETALLGLVKSGATKEAVWCAVKQLAADVGFNPSTARAARISARGKAFLDKVASR